MELQDNPNSDVTKVKAEKGKAYPIRLLHLTNGLIVVGFVIEIFPETILILRPHVVDIDYDRENHNIDGYGFEPYLDQLVHYDPNSLDPTPFVMSNVISVNLPAPHLVGNYESIIAIKSIAADDVDKIKLTKRNYLNTQVKH